MRPPLPWRRLVSSAVRYGAPGAAATGFGQLRLTSLAFPAVLERLREAIAAEGLWVLHEIGPARQILFFHPDRMVRLLTADPAALLEAPLKLAVMAMPDDPVTIRWIDPAAAFSRYDDPLLAELGRELASSVDRIVATALGNGGCP